MAKSSDTVTLYSPDGRAYEASTPTETTRLKAHGYSETKPSPKAAAARKAPEAPKSS